MKKALLTTLYATFLTCNLFGQDTTYFDADWKPASRKNSTFYRIVKPENGKWFWMDYYKVNNQLQYKGYYKSLDPEIKTGEHIYYFESGKLSSTENYVDGKLEGVARGYYKNGNLASTDNYVGDKQEGVRSVYWEDTGKIMSEIFYVNGIENGPSRSYRHNGVMFQEGNYVKGGKSGTWRYYDESGTYTYSKQKFSVSGKWKGTDGVISNWTQSGDSVTFQFEAGSGAGAFEGDNKISVKGVNDCSPNGGAQWKGIYAISSPFSMILDYEMTVAGCGSNKGKRGTVYLVKIE